MVTAKRPTRLQLNADNSEAVILGTATQLRSAATIQAVEVAGSRLQVAPKMKYLGVTIDSNLQFNYQLSRQGPSRGV